MSYNAKTNWKLDEIVLPSDMNRIEEGIKAVDERPDALKFEKAGGSNTAIVLSSLTTLTDGVARTFIVLSNNSGNPTTINDKQLYKPGTTQAPKLIAGKAVTVWYNATNDCFFIKASAEGDAIAENVLAGKTFSNDDDTSIVGTMPNNGPVYAEIIDLSTEGAVYTILKGFHSGFRNIRVKISGLIASVIKAGTNVGGVTGTFTSDATAVSGDILSGKTAYKNGSKLTGTMPVAPTFPNENIAQEVHYYGTNMNSSHDSNNVYVNVPKGYYDGTWLGFSEPNLIPTNVKAGVTIGSGTIGITGTFTSDATATTGDILSGKTAYKNGAKVTGNIPLRSIPGGQTAVSVTGIPGHIYLQPPAGYYDSTGNSAIKAIDPDFIASNFLATKNIFGLQGSIPSQGAQTITPGTTNKTIASGQYLSGVQTIAGDADLIPANILSGKNIFGVVGNVIAGKRFASGTATSQYLGSYRSTYGTDVAHSSIVVTGLTFKPTTIYIDGGTYNTLHALIYKSGVTSGIPCFAISVQVGVYEPSPMTTYVFEEYNGATLQLEVTNTGFKLPISVNGPVKWWAYE